MAIELNTPGAVERIPVLRRKQIGERFVGMLIDTPQSRDRLKKNDLTGAMEPMLKPDGKTRQELVIKLLALPGATMRAGLGDDIDVPAEGTVVRAILKGKAYGDWIDATKPHGTLQVGDVVMLDTTLAQAYDANGKPTGPELTTQADADAVPRERSLGFYGRIFIRRANPDEAAWVAKAEAAYHAAQQANAIPLGNPPATAPAGPDLTGVWSQAAPTAAPQPQTVGAPTGWPSYEEPF